MDELAKWAGYLLFSLLGIVACGASLWATVEWTCKRYKMTVDFAGWLSEKARDPGKWRHAKLIAAARRCVIGATVSAFVLGVMVGLAIGWAS